MVVESYIGRAFDYVAFGGAVAPGEAQLAQSLFGAASTGEIITGVQKLAQAWTIEFLTEIGTVPFQQTRGTRFMTNIRLGAFRTEYDVIIAFRFAAADAKKRLQNAETATTHNEERINDAILKGLALDEDFLSLNVLIESLAFTTREVILPIPVLPIQPSL